MLKEWFDCSESQLELVSREILKRSGGKPFWVFLEGPLGSGKSTLARSILEQVGVGKQAQGSPTFPIAYEYTLQYGSVFHIDLYRLDSEMEVESAGILEYFSNPKNSMMVEWMSKFPKLKLELIPEKNSELKVFELQIEISENLLRKIKLKLLSL